MHVALFPESFNKLRQTLHDHFPLIWYQVGQKMVHDPMGFYQAMSFHLNMTIDPDMSLDINCHNMLRELEKMKKYQGDIILPGNSTPQ